MTAPYVESDGVYLVPAGSPVRSIDDVDRDGVGSLFRRRVLSICN